MANTFIPIATVTVGAGGASTIDFTSIPATFTDLLLLVSARGTITNATDDFTIRFNGTTTNYTSRGLEGYGSGSPASYSITDIIANSVGASATASTFGNASIYIPNYAGSNNKSVSSDSVGENNATSATASFNAGLWSNTAAITSIKLQSRSASNFVQHSTATLYGIKNS